MARPSSVPSLLGPETRVVGRVAGAGALRIDGTVEGDVSVTGPLEIGPGGSVVGNVAAEALTVEGTLTGDADCTGAIRVGAGATVRGTLRGAGVAIAPGARAAVTLEVAFDLEGAAPRRTAR